MVGKRIFSYFFKPEVVFVEIGAERPKIGLVDNFNVDIWNQQTKTYQKSDLDKRSRHSVDILGSLTFSHMDGPTNQLTNQPFVIIA